MKEYYFYQVRTSKWLLAPSPRDGWQMETINHNHAQCVHTYGECLHIRAEVLCPEQCLKMIAIDQLSVNFLYSGGNCSIWIGARWTAAADTTSFSRGRNFFTLLNRLVKWLPPQFRRRSDQPNLDTIVSRQLLGLQSNNRPPPLPAVTITMEKKCSVYHPSFSIS